MQNNESLYQIADKYLQAFDQFESMPDTNLINSQCVTDTLDAIESEFDHKADNIAAYCKHLKAMISANREAVTEMKSRREVMESKLRSMEKYIIDAMNKLNRKKIESHRFVISTRDNAPATIIEDASKLDKSYILTKTTESVDKTAIKSDIMHGLHVDGARLERTKTLSIR